jgi:hypothetical protein
MAGCDQSVDEIRGFSLQKRLSAGYFHQGTTEGLHCFDNLIDAPVHTFMVGIDRIAVSTTEVATSQSYKNTWSATVKRFALYAMKNLVYQQGHNE